MTSWDLCYYLLRANYDRVESGYLEGGQLPEVRDTDGKVRYEYGCNVTSLEDLDSKVKVHFTRQRDTDTSPTESSLTADLVIAADGPSSTIRALFEPDIQRTYAGYVVLRGTVPESQASDAALSVFRERFTFFHAPGIQNLTYTIAGANGTTTPGERLLNFVWYANFPSGSEELETLMTDRHGRRRRITIPPGQMSDKAWDMVKKKGEDRLPPQMAEMVSKTRNPFVQCITDVITPRSTYMSDKVVLVGDALAGFRPHTVASTSQAAFDCMSLVSYLDGTISRKEWITETMQFARLIQDRGVKMGNRSQYEELPVEEYVKDRNLASTPRMEDHYPEWTREGLDV